MALGRDAMVLGRKALGRGAMVLGRDGFFTAALSFGGKYLPYYSSSKVKNGYVRPRRAFDGKT